MKNKNNLIWLDLEMTGLDPEIHYIIEISTIITNKNLDILSEGPNIVIFQPLEKIKKIPKKFSKIHKKNGLLKKVVQSKINEKKAEEITINFLKKWVPKNKSPICGNTIAHDRRFLFKYMPNLEKYFHYRNLDVSSIKEVIKRWKPDILKEHIKKKTHRAILDIKESIQELKFYKKIFFSKNIMK